MPAWMLAARALIASARAVAGRFVSRGGVRTLALAGGGGALGTALADPSGGLLPGFGGGEISPITGLPVQRRRRRRRALTASDRADIAFIAGALGPGAGKAFAVQLVAGLTR